MDCKANGRKEQLIQQIMTHYRLALSQQLDDTGYDSAGGPNVRELKEEIRMSRM